jgi:hypothetical protein
MTAILMLACLFSPWLALIVFNNRRHFEEELANQRWTDLSRRVGAL